MKILHLLKSNRFSGAESVAISLMELFPEYETIYASPEGSIKKAVAKRGLSFCPLKNTTLFEIKSVINKVKPDLIHAHDFSMATKAAIVCGKIPVVAHLHNDPLWLPRLNPKGLLFALALCNIKQVISVSSSIEAEYLFRDLLKNKNTTISNIVDIRKILQLASVKNDCTPYDLIYLGRMAVPKNPIGFCRIVEGLKCKIPTISAMMIGDGYLKEEVCTYISEHYLKENIEIVGFQDNPYAYVAEGKIMVMPSTWEGFGLAAVEGLCLGKPIICSGVGGLRDIVDTTCGAICNNTEDFIDTIFALLTDSERYTKMSKSAAEKAWQFGNKEEYREKIKLVYEKALT